MNYLIKRYAVQMFMTVLLRVDANTTYRMQDHSFFIQDTVPFTGKKNKKKIIIFLLSENSMVYT